uniref:Fibronectin type-III domain-containing protein n=1 Tax=Amphimedon queenslandica TaxID=400682 RepID=A0A1X7TCA9_AMPQE
PVKVTSVHINTTNTTDPCKNNSCCANVTLNIILESPDTGLKHPSQYHNISYNSITGNIPITYEIIEYGETVWTGSGFKYNEAYCFTVTPMNYFSTGEPISNDTTTEYQCQSPGNGGDNGDDKLRSNIGLIKHELTCAPKYGCGRACSDLRTGKREQFFYLALLGSTTILSGGSRLPVSAKRRNNSQQDKIGVKRWVLSLLLKQGFVPRLLLYHTSLNTEKPSINTTTSVDDAAGSWWCSGEAGVDCTDREFDNSNYQLYNNLQQLFHPVMLLNTVALLLGVELILLYSGLGDGAFTNFQCTDGPVCAGDKIECSCTTDTGALDWFISYSPVDTSMWSPILSVSFNKATTNEEYYYGYNFKFNTTYTGLNTSILTFNLNHSESVRIECANGDYGDKMNTKVTDLGYYAKAPTNLTTTFNPSGVTLQWEDTGNNCTSTEYQVTVISCLCTSTSVLMYNTSKTALHLSSRDLLENVTYTYTVRGWNEQESNNSKPFTL